MLQIIPIYKSFKVKSYFQLKSKTPVALCSNVVYHFTCSCDTNKTYIGMSSRHLSTRVQEHLNFNSNQKSSIKDHIMSCNFFFFFLHCPLFREGCGGSSSRLSRHTSRSSITSIISLGRSPKRFHPRSSM